MLKPLRFWYHDRCYVWRRLRFSLTIEGLSNRCDKQTLKIGENRALYNALCRSRKSSSALCLSRAIKNVKFKLVVEVKVLRLRNLISK